MTEQTDNNAADRPIAAVALNKPMRRYYDYLVPDQLRGKVHVGGRVHVPFGPQKGVLGYCVELKDESDAPTKSLREITRALDDEPVFTEKMLRLGRWMADYYHCSMGEALAARNGR